MTGMRALSEDSRQALGEFESRLVQTTRRLHADSLQKYFLVTAEWNGSLAYGLVTNFGDSLLRLIDPGFASGMIARIRDRFLRPFSRGGTVRTICGELRKKDAARGRLLAVEITDSGELGEWLLPSGLEGGDEDQIRQVLQGRQSVGPDIPL